LLNMKLPCHYNVFLLLSLCLALMVIKKLFDYHENTEDTTIAIGLPSKILNAQEEKHKATHQDVLNYIRYLRRRDQSLVEAVTDFDIDSVLDTEAELKFQRIITQPVQGVCQSLKRFGGGFREKWKAVDGDKFVCMDDKRLWDNNGRCIIYTFGISDDWSFEDDFDNLGCSIFAFDPSVNYPRTRGRNIVFKKLGLGADTKRRKNGARYDLETLENIFKMNNHSESVINYLKIDVEGEEAAALPKWISSGALKNVEQFGMEIHGWSGKVILKSVQDLYNMGFRLVSYEANLPMGKGRNGIYRVFEIVFMKDNIWNKK